MYQDTFPWGRNTTYCDIDVFQFQSNETLVIRRTDGTYPCESVYDEEPPGRLVIKNDSNVVLYVGCKVKWSTKNLRKSLTSKFASRLFFLT